MKIITSPDVTGVAPIWASWTAVTEDYDGAPDSRTRYQIGYGATEEAAIADLLATIGDGP